MKYVLRKFEGCLKKMSSEFQKKFQEEVLGRFYLTEKKESFNPPLKFWRATVLPKTTENSPHPPPSIITEKGLYPLKKQIHLKEHIGQRPKVGAIRGHHQKIVCMAQKKTKN